jgi:hypothetical protein
VVTNKEADRISDSEVRTGIYLDRLAHFDGRALEGLQQQITIWQTPEDVCRELPKVEMGAAVLIDEAQTVFRAMQRVFELLMGKQPRPGSCSGEWISTRYSGSWGIRLRR